MLYSKKRSIIVVLIGLFCLVLAFTLLFVGAKLQSNGASKALYLPFCLSFFPICIGIIIFLICYPRILSRHIHAQLEKNNEFEVMEHIDFDVMERFDANHFQMLEEGYLYRKEFAFSEDYVQYFVKKCFSNDIQETMDQEFKRFDACQFEPTNHCLILIVEKDEVNKEDLDAVSKAENVFISLEIIPRMINSISIIALLDKFKQSVYLVIPSKNKPSIYNAGYELIKKVLQTQNDSNIVS